MDTSILNHIQSRANQLKNQTYDKILKNREDTVSWTWLYGRVFANSRQFDYHIEYDYVVYGRDIL